MARAFPQIDPGDYGQAPGEWQALRGELVALLDQVESQVQRTSRQDTQYQGLTERMRDLRFQVGEAEPDTRHREALLSVKRAVDRFSDRDDGGYSGQSQYAPERGLPPNPRDSLQSAIQQIRASTSVQAPRPAPAPAAPRLDEFAEAVAGISLRLERLEGELKTQARSQTGNVKEIAEQVGQLSHVVELLAGAVGETGQVKRLEGQIASLAKMVAQGPQVDLSSLNKRLDDVSSTVGKLAELQRAYAERIDDSGFSQRLDTMSSTVGRLADLQVQFADKVTSADKSSLVADGMRAIEEGVRNIYDRIDTIEKHTSLAPADLEKLTDELARFTEAMRNQTQPQGLVELIDALNTRIGDMENRSPDVGGLKTDVAALRQAVVEAMEPRFAAIEMQIEALSDRVAERPADISVGQLEAQVRQLVARMDQTGEQLTGLAKLYSQPSEPAPDFEALANLVATRTSDALVRIDTPASGMDETSYAEIEKRVGKALKTAAREQVPEDFTGMREGIREVNDRLARLESSLMDRAKEAARIEAAPLAYFTPPVPTATPAPAPFAETPPRDPIAEAIAAAEKTDPPPPRRSDAMPANPADEAPLTAKPFGDMSPIRTALEAKNGPRKRHPGLGPQAEPAFTPAPAEDARPSYDPALAATPPRPVSSFESASPEPFATPAEPAAQGYPADATATPSANTFIQAHRRAARQVGTPAKAEPAPTGATSNSLIGRALARFQSNKAEAVPEVVEPPRERKGVPKRVLAGDKQAPTEWKPDEDVPAAPKSVFTPAPEPRTSLGDAIETPLMDGDDEPKVSFITRHRRVILLALTVAAVSILALNLVAQRSKPAAPAPTPAASDVSAIEPVGDLLDAEPIGDTSAITAPRVIPMVDSLATGSIDPMSLNATTSEPMAFMPTTAVPAMPLAFSSKNTTVEIPTGTIAPAPGGAADAAVAAITPLDLPEPLPAEIASPVKVELPPEGLGPEDLRKAAADGDARAQFEIAAIYTEGRAVTEDLAQAAVWYERAAAQGFAPAQYRLGNLYENGKGVAKDLQQARLWYQRAAEAGNRMSMHNLAALYAGGELGKQEFDSAARWFEQAAARGMKDSQFNLGMLYARGLGVKQDMEASFKWFSLAANRGDADAAKARDDIARSLGADAVTRLNAEIATWRPQQVDMAANYAPIGTWSKAFDPGEQITKKEVVLNVQLALNLLGYDVGTPDGMAGPKTTEAIKAFERATGMSESGAINPRLLAVLGSQPV
jgi:localization factor PodJL